MATGHWRQLESQIPADPEPARWLHRYHEKRAQTLARELHGGAAQSLAAALMQLELHASGAPAPQRTGLVEIRDTLRELGAQLQTLTTELRPPLLDHCGLIAALEGLAESFGRRTGIEARVIADLARRVPRPTDVALYRTAQVALDNVRDHAGAQRVTLELRRRNHCLALRVQDDGRGFELASLSERERRGGLGFGFLRALARSLGGRFLLSSANGQGTRLEMSLPMED